MKKNIFILALGLSISVASAEELQKEKVISIQGSALQEQVLGSKSIQKNISEFRLFLTKEEGVIRGEIIVKGKIQTKQIPLIMDKKEVVFSLSGETKDEKSSYGIYSATFKAELKQNPKAFQKRIERNLNALQGKSNEKLLKTGRRNIVPAKNILDKIKPSKKQLSKTIKRGEQLLKLAEFKSPLQGALELGIDIDSTPFIVIPGSANNDFLPTRKIFDFAILPFFPPILTTPIDQEASLMITDIGVVEDPDRTFDSCTGTGTQGGVWSAGYILREMSQGSNLSPEEFAKNWLSNLVLSTGANGHAFNEPARANGIQSKILTTWDKLDGLEDNNFNVDFFPARLMAIVNRVDLAGGGYGSSNQSAGEARFVFGLTSNHTGSCQPLRFTAIFEYGIKGGSCSAIKGWHQRWKDLDNNLVGSSNYNSALEAITHDFTDFGAQVSGESALNQLRTNENDLGDFEWQLLEFTINGSGNLELTTVKQSPITSLDDTSVLQGYLESDESNILLGQHEVPERFPTQFNPFLASHSEVPTTSFVWDVPNPPGSLTNYPETRRLFSLNTCNGCHAGETNTSFTHIGSNGIRNVGSEAVLSDFLKGTGMPVSVVINDGTTTSTTYNDLAEREQAMSEILNQSCFERRAIAPLKFVH